MKKFFKENSLSLVMFAIFLLSATGQLMTGHLVYNKELITHGSSAINLTQYLSSGHFIESLFENWESEFLQMGAFVVLTIFLKQKGSSESKAPSRMDEAKASVNLPQHEGSVPWAVKRGGWILKVYKHSLSIALFSLFLISFALHAIGGARAETIENALHGDLTQISAFQYIGESKFWFESFQNWQSEFLSVGVLIVLSIFLREKGSPQSKKVETPNSKNEEEAA